MNNTLFLYLSQLRGFWRFRARVRRMLFGIQANIFRLRSNVREGTSDYSSFWQLLRASLGQILMASSLAALLQFLNPYLYPIYLRLHLSVSNDEHYVTLLATISGMGGIFIGLYYAAISTVGGAIYARVPNNIRDLLVRERFGNVYMGFLSFLTFFSLALVALRALDFPPIPFVPAFATLLAGVGIISFVRLGRRAFNLFDPTALSQTIFQELQDSLSMVRAGAFRWQDRSFQRHAHRRASATLDTLETLADITSKETHLNGKPFIDLVESMVHFSTFYQHTKRLIPSDSHWYEQRYEHRDWYRTEDSRVAMAHQTGTALEPNVATDSDWVEQRIVPILLRCIDVNLREERYLSVLELLPSVERFLQALAKEGACEKAFHLLAQIAEHLLSNISPPLQAEAMNEEMLEKLALAERLASMPISILIAFREAYGRLDGEALSTELSRIAWQSNASIYEGRLPTYLLPRLEWLSSRLNFELAVEDTAVSPTWYQSELLIQVECERLVANIEALTTQAAAQYCQWEDTTLTALHPWLAAAIMSREWEYWHKTEHLLEIAEERWKSLNQNHRIEGLPWPDYNSGTVRSRNAEIRQQLLLRMSKQSVRLAVSKTPPGFPDYPGQFLHTIGEASFEALIGNNSDQLKGLFKSYFYGCLLRYEKLKPTAPPTDWRATQEIEIASAALLDLMDLSGYARLMADCYSKEDLWNQVASVWDKHMEPEAPGTTVQFLAAVISLTESAPYVMPHRSILRTTWSQRVFAKLRDVPRKVIRGSRWHDEVVDHQSPLVRIYARGPFGPLHDGIDIFLALYLRLRPEAASLNFGWRRRDLKEEIEHEERRYAEWKSQQKEEHT